MELWLYILTAVLAIHVVCFWLYVATDRPTDINEGLLKHQAHTLHHLIQYFGLNFEMLNNYGGWKPIGDTKNGKLDMIEQKIKALEEYNNIRFPQNKSLYMRVK
jgi:hypothetical protein